MQSDPAGKKLKRGPELITHARNLIRASDLTWAWTIRIVRGRYQQSALGWLWAIVQPVATVAIFTIVFTRFVHVDTGDLPYILFSYTAVVPWTFFSASLSDMAISLVQNMSLVTKIYFPREVLPIAAMMARLMDFGISFALLALLMVYYQFPVSPLLVLLYLPVILCIQLALIAGLGLTAAALNVFYRDVDPLTRLGLQIWFYASPVIYPVTLVPEKMHVFYFLNPMAGILTAYRDVLLLGRQPGYYLVSAFVVSTLILLAGYWLFKRVESQFADVV